MNRLTCPVEKLSLRPTASASASRWPAFARVTSTKSRPRVFGGLSGAETLLHPTAYYTLNRVPDGARIVPIHRKEAELCVAPVPAAAAANTKKHPVKAPDWTGDEGDQTILLGTQPGLKFDTTLLTVKPGSRVRLVFRNSDDKTPHNFVLCAPGRGQAVGEAAMALGIDGPAKNYVPEIADVLFHTALTLPGASDTIFITMPTAPGDYDFVCTFPGHSALMKGILCRRPGEPGGRRAGLPLTGTITRCPAAGTPAGRR